MHQTTELLSVNIGDRRQMEIGERITETGIYKSPVSGAIRVGKLGIADDVIADTKHHGGFDQAVYIYSKEDYAWWEEKLQQELLPGTFGENLTISGYGVEAIRIGDRFRIGDVLLEVTAPRIPCATLAARMKDPAFVKTFSQAGRPGVYTRVLQTGRIQAGDTVETIPANENHPTVSAVFEIFFSKERDAATIKRLLASPIAERAKSILQEWLGETVS